MDAGHVTLGLVAVAFLLGLGVAWGVDWLRHRGGPPRRSLERAIAERDRATAMTEVVVRAAFADGEMTVSEWAAIERMCLSRFGADADLAGIRQRVMADYAEGVSARRLERDVTTVTWTLSDEDRAEVALLVEELAREGGRIALLDGYRGGSSGDPDRLVAIIRSALGPGKPQ